MNPERQRILFLDPAGQLWGSERSLLLVLEQLDRDRYECAVCLPGGTPLVAKLRSREVCCFPWFVQRLHQRGLWARFRALAGLFFATFAFRPRVIHVNQAGAVHIAYFVAQILRRYLVIHVRLTDDAPLVGRRVRCWKDVMCIAISRFVAEQLQAAGVPQDKIVCVTDPIAIEKSQHPESSLRRWHAGFVGRLSRDKGVELFLRAFGLVVDRKPEARALVIGSSGEKTSQGQNYMEAMKELARELRIAAQVDFLGFREDVLILMSQMNVFVMSSAAEPWGRVVAEAMIAGAAVVAVNAGGPREIVTDGINGLLVEPNNPKAMADAVLRLNNDMVLARKLVAAGRLWVAKECDVRKHASRIEAVYDMLIGANG